ncbi:MAG: ketosteroid isomerase-like protein, partial [Candidatus Azotimanducaceae bacterium]
SKQVDLDYTKVKSLILEALAIIRSDNFERYFDLFTEDAVWMMPSSSEDVHVDKARTFYGFTKNFWFDQVTSIDELVISGDIAFVRVSFDGYLRPKKDNSARPLQSKSRHIWVLQRQIKGDWKISRDIWNNPK